MRLFSIGTETAKDAVSAYLRVEVPGPGYCHFPDTTDENGQPLYDGSYFEQLVSEKPIEKYIRGVKHRVWVKIKQKIRNEALDLRVYNLAALSILNPNLRRLAEGLVVPTSPGDVQTTEPKQRREATKAPKRPGFVNPMGWSKGFVNRWR